MESQEPQSLQEAFDGLRGGKLRWAYVAIDGTLHLTFELNGEAKGLALRGGGDMISWRPIPSEDDAGWR